MFSLVRARVDYFTYKDLKNNVTIKQSGNYTVYDCFFYNITDYKKSPFSMDVTQYSTLDMSECTFIGLTSGTGGAMNIKGACDVNMKFICLSECKASVVGSFMYIELNRDYDMNLSYFTAQNGLPSTSPIRIRNTINANNINVSNSESFKTSEAWSYGVYYLDKVKQSFTLSYSTFFNNTSPCGIFYAYYLTVQGTVSKTNFVENIASEFSVFYAQHCSQTIFLDGCTFYYNTLIPGKNKQCYLITSDESHIQFIGDSNSFYDNESTPGSYFYITRWGKFTDTNAYKVTPDNGPLTYKYYQTAVCYVVDPYTEEEPIPVQTPMATPDTTPFMTPASTPSNTPSITPSNTPSKTPFITPFNTPSITPSNTPSITPSNTPSITPSDSPSATPSSTPSTTPSSTPSNTPSTTPSDSPSTTPSNTPESSPMITPSDSPSTTPNDTPFIDSPLRTPLNIPSSTPSKQIPHKHTAIARTQMPSQNLQKIAKQDTTKPEKEQKKDIPWIWIGVGIGAALLIASVIIGVTAYKKSVVAKSDITNSESAEMTTVITTTDIDLNVTLGNTLFTTTVNSDDPFSGLNADDPFAMTPEENMINIFD